MILEASPDSPAVIRVAAATILYLHIGAGLTALVAGAGALAFRKGSQLHRISGNVFFIAMLVMATIGAAVSPFLKPPRWDNVIAGLFTVYLVSTAWMTVQRKGSPKLFETGALVFAIGIALATISLGVSAINRATAEAASSVVPLFLFGTLVSLAAAGDFRMILRGGISGVQRMVRHLWRMCYALAIATASLFLGQPQVFPKSVRGTGILAIPVVAVLTLMIFWLIRVRFAKRGRQLASSA